MRIDNEDIKALFNNEIGTIEWRDPKRVCVFKTGTYDVEIVMDGPDNATFASKFPGFKLAIPESYELAELPVADYKYVGAASLDYETSCLRINRVLPPIIPGELEPPLGGTLVVVLNADWRRELLGVDYEDFREMSIDELLREKYDGVKVFIDLDLQKSVLEFLLLESGGIPSTGLWIAGRYYDTFMVQWGEPNGDFHFRCFDCDTLFERMRDDKIEEVDYNG